MFNISFVVVTVKARLPGFPRHLEEAAMDLGANEWTTFWKVTFPLILPGVMAAALLAFSLSIDDYVITSFTAGQTQTFPLYIYGSQLRGIPVQVNVIGTIIFVTAVGLVLLRRSGSGASPPATTLPAPEPDASAQEAPDRSGRHHADRPGRRHAAGPLPDHSVVPPVWGRITNLDRRSRRGIVADHDVTASATSTTRRGSASPTRATPIPGSSRPSRRRPPSSSTASRTSCTTSPACGSTTGSGTCCPATAGARSSRTRGAEAVEASVKLARVATGRPAILASATATTAGRPRRWR